MHKHFRSLAALALVACVGAVSTALRTAYDAGSALVAGAVLGVQLLGGALLFAPATIAGNLGSHALAAKMERGAVLVWFRVGSWLAVAKELAFRRYLSPFVARMGWQLYAFPGTVTADLAFGIVGELAFDGPYRSQPARISHATAADIVIGRWFTLAADGTARPGGAGAVGGVLMAPKTHANLGTAAGGALAANMTLPTGTIGEFAYMGALVVSVGAAVALGNAAKYDTTTGIIGVGAPGAGEAAIPNAKFIRVANAAAGLAVLELTN